MKLMESKLHHLWIFDINAPISSTRYGSTRQILLFSKKLSIMYFGPE